MKKKKKKDVAPRNLLVALVFPIAESLVEPANPAYDKLGSLNEHCDNKENQRELWNATQIKSAATVTATQFRDVSGRHEYGCTMKLFTKYATGLIVSFVEMNLRSGALNGSCIDYVFVETTYGAAAEQDRCAYMQEDQHSFFHMVPIATLKLHTPPPLPSFFEEYTLPMVVTSFSQGQLHPRQVFGLCREDWRP